MPESNVDVAEDGSGEGYHGSQETDPCKEAANVEYGIDDLAHLADLSQFAVIHGLVRR